MGGRGHSPTLCTPRPTDSGYLLYRMARRLEKSTMKLGESPSCDRGDDGNHTVPRRATLRLVAYSYCHLYYRAIIDGSLISVAAA